MAYEFSIAGKVISGPSALEAGTAVMKSFGRKALIVAGPNNIRLGNVEKLMVLLQKEGIAYCIYDGVASEPSDRMVEEGANIYRDEKCDFLIAIGGGSPMDTMKAIAVTAVSNKKIGSFMGVSIDFPLPKMAAIPATAGTGSETTQFTVITDLEKNIKMLIKGPSLVPDLAILESILTMTAPASVTAATGMDALTHAVEAYISKKAQPLTDTFAISAVKRIFRYLPKSCLESRDAAAKEEMALAAFEAGVTINNSSVTLVHGMSRPIGALFHVPHGISNAMLLDACFSFVLEGACKRFADLGRAVDPGLKKAADREAAESFLKGIRNLCKICRIPTLEEYGISQKDFKQAINKMSEDALASGSPQNSRVTISKEDIVEIYKRLWMKE